MCSCYNMYKENFALEGEWPLKAQKPRSNPPVGSSPLLPRLLVCGGLILLLVLAAVWLNRPEGGTPTASSQLVFVPAKVTAVLSDDAQPDDENGEGRRVGTQELEIRILSGPHKEEILPLI